LKTWAWTALAALAALLAWAATQRSVLLATSPQASEASQATTPNAAAAAPPAAAQEPNMTLHDAIANRRSLRRYAATALELDDLMQVLWAAQGITGRSAHYRAIPSAGALHPLELYVAAGDVAGLEAGLYHYRISDGTLQLLRSGDQRAAIKEAALGQEPLGTAPAVLLVAAVFERTTVKYGQRGLRYVFMEVGHLAQNVYLQAQALGLGTVSMGAFHDDRVQALLGEQVEPLLIMPLGVRERGSSP